MTDITDDKIEFELNKLPFDERDRDGPLHVNAKATLTFDLKTRTYGMALTEIFGKDGGSIKTKKFINSVPTQAIAIAARCRQQKMQKAGIATSSFTPASETWANAFVYALEPLADAVLAEYGRQLASGHEPKLRETGMAAAAALLRLSSQSK